jgi:uncharacterized protein
VRDRLSRALWVAGWPVRAALLVLIGAYRLTLGRIVGGNCRFYPSCSAYAEEAVRRRGAVRGVALAAWRVLRCSPLSKGGVDHPPGSVAHPLGDVDRPRGGVEYDNDILSGTGAAR